MRRLMRYIRVEIRKPKIQLTVLLTLAGIVGSALTLAVSDWLNARNAVRTDQLTRQRENDRQKERMQIMPSWPNGLSYDLRQGQRISMFNVTCTNASELPIVIDTGTFFRIRGMEDDGAIIWNSDQVARVRIYDAVTGRELQPHQRMDPKAILNLCVEVSRATPTADARIINAALASGRLHRNAAAHVEVPALDLPGPSLRMALDPGDLILYLGLSTSLGASQEVRLGGV